MTTQARQNELLVALLEISRSITVVEKKDDFLRLVLQKAIELTRSTAGDIRLFDLNTNELEISVMVGTPVKDVMKRTKITEGITGWVAKTGNVANVSDVSQDDRYLSCIEGTRSELACPLKHRGEVIGVLNVENNKMSAFDDNDERILEALASHAAIAIDNARLIDQLRLEHKKQSDILEVFYRIGSKITTKPELIPVLKAITGGVYRIINADIPLVYLYDEDRQEFNNIVFGDISDEWEDGCKPRSHGSGQQAIKDRQIIFARDTNVNPFARKKGVKITVAAPLICDSFSAVLYMHFLEEAFNIEAEEVIAKDLSKVSEKLVSLIQETKWGTKIEEIREKLAEIISKVNILDEIRKIADADIFLIYLYDPQTERFTNVILAELNHSWEECKPRAIGAGRESIKKNELIITTVDSVPDINPFPKRKGVITTAAYPLKLRQKCLGVLYMNFMEGHIFEDVEKMALKMLGGQAAVIIELTKLYHDLAKDFDALRAMYEIGKIMLSKSTSKEVANNIAKAIGSFCSVREEMRILNIYLYDSEDIRNSKFLACTSDPAELKFGNNKIRVDGVGAKVVEKVMKNESRPYLIIPTENGGSQLAKELGAKTTACFPLKLNLNQIVALLYIHLLIPYEFTEEEINKYTILSDLAAIAIENASRLEQCELKLGDKYDQLFGTHLIDSIMALRGEVKGDES